MERFEPELPIQQIRVVHNVRRRFDEQALTELAQSIKEAGVQEPLIVRPVEDGYDLVAGERRLRAATMAGLTAVPAIVREMDESTAARVQLTENLQRKDLDPVEEAEGFERLIRDHGLRAREIAQQLGVSEAFISNRRRLLKLPEETLDDISHEKLSASVALTLVDLAANPELVGKAAAALIKQHATQERAPAVVAETLATACPLVGWNGYSYGNEKRTCDQSAHKDCNCRRHVKPPYSSDLVVCVDPERYAQVEAEAEARLAAKRAAEMVAVGADDGVLDLSKLKWESYGSNAQYRNVTSPHGQHRECEGDHSQCACQRLARQRNDGPVFKICMDPKAFDRIENQAKRAKTKAEKAAMKTEQEEMSEWALDRVGAMMNRELPRRIGQTELAYLAAWVFLSCEPEYGPGNSRVIDRGKYLAQFGIDWAGLDQYHTHRVAVASRLLEAEPAALLRRIFEWPLLAQPRSGLGVWYRRQLDPTVENPDAPAGGNDLPAEDEIEGPLEHEDDAEALEKAKAV